MAECHLWWRAGNIEWCDMMGEACECGGWDENCDMRLKREKKTKAQLAGQAQVAVAAEVEE